MNYFPLRQLCVVLGHNKVNHKYYKCDIFIISASRKILFPGVFKNELNSLPFMTWNSVIDSTICF